MKRDQERTRTVLLGMQRRASAELTNRAKDGDMVGMKTAASLLFDIHTLLTLYPEDEIQV